MVLVCPYVAKVKKLSNNSKYGHWFKIKKRESRNDLLLEIVENTDKISLPNTF